MAKVHPIMKNIEWLLGSWFGAQGQGKYPTIKSFNYEEQLDITNVGQPNFHFNSLTRNPESKTVMHRECGFIRVKPDSNNVALNLAQNTGLSEVEEGEINTDTKEITLTSQSIGRLSFGKEPAVVKIMRTFRLIDTDHMEQVVAMETTRTSMIEHLRIVYVRQS